MSARRWLLTSTGALRAGPALLTSLLGIALAFAFTISYVGQVDARRAQSARQAQEADRRQSEQTRAVVCRLVVAQVDAYADQPPQTATGQSVAETWVQLKAQLGC